ncbi:MAG: undecaprenyl-phosphate glucose phosphotransferase [Rikenellaceae bacterium]
MPQVEKRNKIIKYFVIAIDVVAINLFFLIFSFFIWGKISSTPVFGSDVEIDVILSSLSISYIITSIFNKVILYHRRIRLDQIALGSFKNMVLFFFVWFAISSLMIPHVDIAKPLIYFFCFATVAMIALRIILRTTLMYLRKTGRNQCDVVYLGSSLNMQELYDEMTLRLTTGYKIHGYFDKEPNPEFDQKCKYLGDNSEALEYIKKNKIDRVYCGLTSSYGKDVIVPIINYCEGHVIRFFSIPNLRNYFHRRVTLEMFSNVPMLSIHPEPLSSTVNSGIKRTFDFFFSLVVCAVVVLPAYIIVGIITKITNPGSIIFSQQRHGLDGKEFTCYKFRSMKVNADSDKVQATKDDPRKTKFGDFIRRTSIDELPQFWNVLKGDMSVVGPRPHMVAHTKEYSKIIGTYMVRHYIKPGITGWAQVTGLRGETKELSDMQGRVKADIWYLEHWTFILDLYIIYKTFANIVSKKDKTTAY